MAAVATMVRPAGVTSAAGVLSLLEEQENKLKVTALERLNEVVDQFWHEIAEYLSDIESFYEDQSFPNRELAALVASKVFYHLEDYKDALRLALGAGRLFDLSMRTEYVEKIVAVAIDEYIQKRNADFEAEISRSRGQEPEGADNDALDPSLDYTALEDVVSRMFQRCKEDKQYKQGLGMALETKRLDVPKSFITESDDI